MNDPQYENDLRHIHESEVYGIALFDTAARLTRNPQRKQKWLALKALEEKTLDGYLAFAEATGQPVKGAQAWRIKGMVDGAALGLLPWRLSMKLLRDGTAPFQEKFLRLKRNADSMQQGFFSYVYSHEKAIEAFSNRELSGDKNSLAAVEKLLTC